MKEFIHLFRRIDRNTGARQRSSKFRPVDLPIAVLVDGPEYPVELFLCTCKKRFEFGLLDLPIRVAVFGGVDGGEDVVNEMVGVLERCSQHSVSSRADSSG